MKIIQIEQELHLQLGLSNVLDFLYSLGYEHRNENKEWLEKKSDNHLSTICINPTFSDEDKTHLVFFLSKDEGFIRYIDMLPIVAGSFQSQIEEIHNIHPVHFLHSTFRVKIENRNDIEKILEHHRFKVHHIQTCYRIEDKSGIECCIFIDPYRANEDCRILRMMLSSNKEYNPAFTAAKCESYMKRISEIMEVSH